MTSAAPFESCLPLLNVRPRPIHGESWPGYLIRLAQTNGLMGISAIARILRMSVVKIVSSNPERTLHFLGIPWTSPTYQSDCSPSSAEREYKRLSLIKAGRSFRARVCPHCLSEDDIRHVRSAWDHPLSIDCKKHSVLLLDKCHKCGDPITQQRRHVDQCDCGESFLHQHVPASPSWISRFENVFKGSVSTGDDQTFSKCSPLAQRASFVAYWLMATAESGRLHLLSDRRIPVTFLSQADVATFEKLLSDWPRTIARNVSDEVSAAHPKFYDRLSRSLCAADFPAMQEVIDWIRINLRCSGSLQTAA